MPSITSFFIAYVGQPNEATTPDALRGEIEGLTFPEVLKLLAERNGQVLQAWAVVFWLLAGLFTTAAMYHAWEIGRAHV